MALDMLLIIVDDDKLDDEIALEILLELEVTAKEDDEEDTAVLDEDADDTAAMDEEVDDTTALDEETDDTKLDWTWLLCTELLELLATGVFLLSLPPQPAKTKILTMPV
jgi:hypothetical protein